MPYPTSSTRLTLKLVSPSLCSVGSIRLKPPLELDALQFEEEEEGPSYLADLNKAPDFIDEPPVEITEVCPGIECLSQCSYFVTDTGEGGSENGCMMEVLATGSWVRPVYY